MTTATKPVPAKVGDIQLTPQTYQQSMNSLNAVIHSIASDSGVVAIQPGQISVVQVQAGKQYKLRKNGNPIQTPDDLIAVRHGDALHVRYADGSVVHFEGFFSTCTDSSVCSVNLASDSASGSTLGADALSSGPGADDGLLVYAHGNPNVLMSMAQDQSGLSAAIQSAGTAGNVTYLAPSPFLGSALFALAAVGGMAAAAGAGTASALVAAPTVTEQDLALVKIGDAAANNNASGTSTPAVVALTVDDYTKAKVTGVNATNLVAINSALDSLPIAKDQANTAAKVQIIVNAYTAILASADGTASNTGTALTGEQYAAIGIAGVAGGAPTEGSALKLLDEMVDKSANGDVNTIAKLQIKADAAAHLLAAAGGGTNANVAKLSIADLIALGITNVTADNIDAVRAAIKGTPDASIDTLSEVKAIVDTAVAGIAIALTKISTAAGADNASGTSTPAVAALTVDDYSKASVTGVNATNITAINNALDTQAITAVKTDTTAELQTIVNAYTAILASADGMASNTGTALTGEQYAAIGVIGVASGTPTDGSALKLLDEMVDKSVAADVNTIAKLQVIADASAHVMTAAGLPAGTTNPLTTADLTALGITGLNANNAQAVINAIVATTSDSLVDTLAKLQAVATAAETKAATALATIIAADSANTAEKPALQVSVFTDVGISGLTITNTALLGAVNSALDTGVAGVAHVSSTATIQSVVDNYTAILASANGAISNSNAAITGNQYADVGVTGVSGATAPVAGTNVFLLDSAVEAKLATAVDTVPELQAMATAATDVMAAANHGTTNVTAAELTALGIIGDFTVTTTVDAVNAAIHSSVATAVDTVAELQSIANNAVRPALSSLIGNVTNLDVTSNLVFTSTSAVHLTNAGTIHITETGGAGYGGEAVAGKSQIIDLSNANDRSMVSIDASGTRITINPAWDLDLGATYSISIDAGSFESTDTLHLASIAVSGMMFGTVTPGTHVTGHTVATDAQASQIMVDSTGALAASKSWLNIGNLGDNTSSATLLGSLDTGAYALVLENYSTKQSDPTRGFSGILAHDTNVSVTSFGADDLIYFDAQANNASTQRYDPALSNQINGNGHGGVAGQTGMEIGLVSSPTQSGSSAQILIGFVGNTTNQIFSTVYTSTDGQDLGFGTFLHSTPVIMG